MASATGFTLFHCCHSDTFVLLIRSIQCGMTFTASCNFYVNLMTKMCGTGLFYFERYLLDGMTCNAFIQSKGFLAVVASTT